MDYMDREGNRIANVTGQDKYLYALYATVPGRAVMKLLAAPVVSGIVGKFMDSWMSTFMISSFVRKNGIRLSDYERKKYRSFNEFFTRRIKPEKRPIDQEQTHLIAPCDSLVTVYPIDLHTRIKIKHSVYTVGSLLQNDRLAAAFTGGYCVVCRLSVDNYHRYCYIDNAVKGRNHFIPGVLHTVNPAVLEHIKIYKENSREYCVMDTANFGRVVQMEVGAMLVGRIRNNHQVAVVRRGQEKGCFDYGGSTVVLLFQRDQLAIDDDILKNSAQGIETKIHMGEKIGKAMFS